MTHVETGRQIRLNNLVPLLESHLVHGAITRDTGIIDQHFNRTNLAFDCPHGGLASVIISDIKAMGRNTGFGGKLLRRFIITRVGSNDLITGTLQCQADRFTDTASPACYQSYSAHVFSPLINWFS